MGYIRRVTLGVMILLKSSAAISSTVLIEVPEMVRYGDCRPINVSKSEMQRQWQLYSDYAKTLSVSESLTNAEIKAQQHEGLKIEFAQCYTGSNVFAAMCLSHSTLEHFQFRTIKLMHRSDGADCLYISNGGRN